MPVSIFIKNLVLLVLAASILLPANVQGKGKPKQVVNIALLTQEQKVKPPSSNLDPLIADLGLPGAELGIEDNNTTGEYTKQQFVLKKYSVPSDGDVQEVYQKQIANKFDYVIANLSPKDLLTLADTEAAKHNLVFDIGSIDDELRNQACRANLFHILPSRSMRTDALAQYFMKKKWQKWFLVVGAAAEDKLYAGAVTRSARKFGSEIVLEKPWEHTFDARRSAQADVAVFTQADEYDVLLVADEFSEFGEYLDYRTWLPRPVAGTQGLVATSWHKTHEQWGAAQIQKRFQEKAGRWMEEVDYAAYIAVRAVGEAATRTQSNEVNKLREYLLSDQFALQGYKGTPLSFRTWNHQLRQPILLAAPRSMVAVAPIEGFMHPKTELDTLGYDQPETGCQWSHEK